MLKFAIRNLLSRRIRSLLSLLGLTVAIIGMVGLFSVAEGLDALVSDTFGRIPGLLAMQPGAPVPLFSRIPADWEEDIQSVPGVSVVNSEIWQRVNVIGNKMVISPPRFLFGTDIETRLRLSHGVYREEIVEGRFLGLSDRGTKNTVISKQIAEEFGKQIGDALRVNGRDFNIVGIYHCGSLLLDVAIILDIGTVRQVSRFDPGSVSAFYIEQTGEVDDELLAEQIREKFRGREVKPWQPSSLGLASPQNGNPILNFFKSLGQKLNPPAPPNDGAAADNRSAADGALPQNNDHPNSQPENKEPPKPKTTAVAENDGPDHLEDPASLPLEVRSAADWAERFDRFTSDLDLFLTIMTSIGVTIAVLSIINTMVMSVTERIIEFGILKANGWSRTDVMKLITFESAVLGFGGGILGSGIGWVATLMINANWPTRVQLYASPGLLSFAIVFATGLGILGGLYPAIWAMRMMPMDAIRRG